MKKNTKKNKLYHSRLSFDASEAWDIEEDCSARLEGCGIALNDFAPVRSKPLNFSGDVATATEGQFYEADFRMLSACIVGAGTYKASDFSDENLLRGSMSLIDKLPICTDHYISADNIRGYVASTYWQESSMSDTGEVIPSGIVGKFMVDKTIEGNGSIVKNLESGALNSDSVTVYFSWKPSHKFANREDFYNALGSMKDGTMVRRIATKITGYAEVSLVVSPADKYARRTKSFQAVSFSKEEEKTSENENKFALSCKIDSGLLSLSKSFSVINNEKEEEVMNKKLEKAIRDRLNLSADVVITDAHVEQFTDLSENKFTEAESFSTAFTSLGLSLTDSFEGRQVVETASFAALEAEVVAAKESVVSLTAEVETLKPQATLGNQFLTEKREKAVLSYQKACVIGGKTPSDGIIKLMNDSVDPKLIDELEGLHVKDATQSLTATCKGCGGHDFSFRSSTKTKEEDEKFERTEKVKTVNDIREQRSRKATFLG